MTLESFIAAAAGGRAGPVSTVIADTLRDAILKGVIPGGAPIRPDHVAAGFGVSHIPVREALRQIGAEGMVKAYPNRGVVAAELPAADARTATDPTATASGKESMYA